MTILHEEAGEAKATQASTLVHQGNVRCRMELTHGFLEQMARSTVLEATHNHQLGWNLIVQGLLSKNFVDHYVVYLLIHYLCYPLYMNDNSARKVSLCVNTFP